MIAFRAGAADVVLKEPEVVPYLRERVVEAAGDIRTTGDRNSLLEEVAETHEEFLRRLRDVSHELLDHEDRAADRVLAAPLDADLAERLADHRRVRAGDDLGVEEVAVPHPHPKFALVLLAELASIRLVTQQLVAFHLVA